MGPAWQRGESDTVESVPSGVRASGGRSAGPRAWAELSGMGRFAGEGAVLRAEVRAGPSLIGFGFLDFYFPFLFQN